MKAILLLAVLSAPQDPPKVSPNRDEIFKQDIESALKRLASDRHTESYLAREELIALGRRAVAAVVAEFQKKDLKPAVKRSLCEILGAVRDPNKDAVAALVAKLKDTDEHGTSIAAAAARALGSIADDAAIPALLETLNGRLVNTDKILKVECIHALGLLRAKEAVEPLRKALEDRKSAALGDPDEDARSVAGAAADALGLLRALEAVDDLAKLLADTEPGSDELNRIPAARALQRIHAAELAGKTDKDEARAGALAGAPEEVRKTLDAWKAWVDERKDKKDVADTRATIEKLSAAIEAYKRDQGKYPLILPHLKSHPEAPKPLPKDGYFQGEMLDAWKEPFKYATPGTGHDFDLYSFGKNRVARGTGAAADLWNHDKWIAVKQGTTKKNMEKILEAVKKFHEDQKVYPIALVNLTTKPAPGGELQLSKPFPEKGYTDSIPVDGFGGTFIYRRPGIEKEPFDLISYGADGAEGGEKENEDVWNHDKRPPKKEEPKKDDKKDEKK